MPRTCFSAPKPLLQAQGTASGSKDVVDTANEQDEPY